MEVLKKNILYQWSYQILAIILPLITAPYISRILGAGNIGVYSYQLSIVNYFMLFAMLGVNTYGNRCIAQVKEDYDHLCRTFTEIFTAQVMTSLLAVLAYCIYVLTHREYQIVAAIQIIYVAGCIFDINWLYFGLENFRLTAIRSFIVKIVTAVCIFTFVRCETDLIKYVLIMALGTVISQCILWYSFPRYVRFVKISFKEVKRHYKGILILFIPTIATSVYKLMDKIMLGTITEMPEVGYYENSEKIINLLLSFIISVGTVMLPRISSLVAQKKDKEARRYIDTTMEAVILVSAAMAFGIISVSKEFIPIFLGEGFERCVPVLNILAFSVIFSSAAQVIRTQYLIPHNMDLQYSFSLAAGAVVNFIVNCILIKPFGAVGTAVGTLVAEGVVCTVQFVIVSKKLDICMYFHRIMVFLSMGLIMSFVIRGIDGFSNIFLQLTVKVIAGAVVYIGLSLLYFRKRIKKNRK